MEPWTPGSAPLRRPEVVVRDREGLVDLGVGVGMVVSVSPEGVDILSCSACKVWSGACLPDIRSCFCRSEDVLGGPVSVDASAIMS